VKNNIPFIPNLNIERGNNMKQIGFNFTITKTGWYECQCGKRAASENTMMEICRCEEKRRKAA
jgi:hypothetical protein